MDLSKAFLHHIKHVCIKLLIVQQWLRGRTKQPFVYHWGFESTAALDNAARLRTISLIAVGAAVPRRTGRRPYNIYGTELIILP